MNYPSCIKLPVLKNDNSPEKENSLFNNVSDKLSLITYDELISIADNVFGTGKWSHAVTSQTIDFVEYVMGKYHIGCAAFVRVELPDKTFHEEMGYSNAESTVKGSAVYSARASSITNALKKALLCFGGVIEKKMNEYVSKNNKRKLDNLIDDSDDNEKVKNNEIVKQSRTISTLKKSANTNAQESERSTSFDDVYLNSTTNECSVKKPEVSETKSRLNSKPVSSFNATNSAQQQQQSLSTNVNTKTIDGISITRTMSEEELRNERKRKQREKQEEYRRQMMKDKELKVEEKSNSKF
ncbi:hypothetical protein PV327_003860 [Microctonus hyperodae]|uniref:DNA repair protein RAD52-like protein n=1 Tax=Microctonus hyperodae TaxID=165561 RepID=A0AA39G555_MICHY|nr:hypothetical protein PV327_003860 [Microctonus hyperodae]